MVYFAWELSLELFRSIGSKLFQGVGGCKVENKSLYIKTSREWSVLGWVGQCVPDWLCTPSSCRCRSFALRSFPFANANKCAKANPTSAPLPFPTIAKEPKRHSWTRDYGPGRRRVVPTIGVVAIVKPSETCKGGLAPPPTNIARHILP
jgi:hypothetical protein